MKRFFLGVLVLLVLSTVLPVMGEGAESAATDAPLEGGWLTPEDAPEELAEDTSASAADGAVAQGESARADFIDRMIDLGKTLYDRAGGKAQRAHYASDIYVCKNFTVYLFRQNKTDFRMAEYPDVKLVIPNNLPRKDCKPYNYGVAWEEIPAEKGNPFYAVASFRYDPQLSKEENMTLAEDFMRQAKRGDYFQMSANYQYGVGAHSAIIIEDYDPGSDSITWMDSNMRGKKVNGIRYGIVQFGEVASVSWWAETFCKKGYGATIYRLRDDIIYNPNNAKD